MFRPGQDCLCRRDAPYLGNLVSPLCWRCSGMVLGLACVLVLAPTRAGAIRAQRVFVALACWLPALVDVGAQIASSHAYRSHRLTRLTTGFLVGMGILPVSQLGWFSLTILVVGLLVFCQSSRPIGPFSGVRVMHNESNAHQPIGSGHAAAMFRLGLKEVREVFNPSRDSIAQGPELGVFGSPTPGEVAAMRTDESTSNVLNREESPAIGATGQSLLDQAKAMGSAEANHAPEKAQTLEREGR